MSTDKGAFITRWATAWARLIVGSPGKVLLVLVALGITSTWLTSRLTIEPDQLKLISQELPEVKSVKRIIDMVGGAGYLQIALRGKDVPTLKKVADGLNAMMEAEKENVRFITYKVPIDFIQENMVLFIKTEDLVEGKKRINAYLKDQVRRNNPFFIEIKKTEPVKLDLKDLIDKYSQVGKKSIRDAYYVSDDGLMQLLLVKPMWNSTELQKTAAYLEHLVGKGTDGKPTPPGVQPTNGLFADFTKKTGITLIEDYDKVGDEKTVYFGFTGGYKTSVDDSYAMQESLDDVLFFAFGFICLTTILTFRKWAPTLIVITGMALGTVMTTGFAKLTLGELNMITSIIGAILMGFGIDYGIHFVYRTRIELGAGKRYDVAISDAIINAGRPALIAAIVTGGSFLVLLVSDFRGFSQFGFLAGVGTLIIGFTLFSWSPAILALAGRRDPTLPARLIGTMAPPSTALDSGALRIPRPGLVLGLLSAVILSICAFSIPWSPAPFPKSNPSLLDRLRNGVRFNYNTRALVPEGQPSIRLLDEIGVRFRISSDPVAVPTKTLEEAKEVFDELTLHPEKYPTIDQVVSVFSFVPPPDLAVANAKVLAEWKEELKDFDTSALPEDAQKYNDFFQRVLSKTPYDVTGVPETYASQFRSLPTTSVENQGYLTFIYPSVDLWDGKQMLDFADQVRTIKVASGKEFGSAGLALLYAQLARTVLRDGRLTVLLAALWILLLHYLDFRSFVLAAASVIPLGIGLWMMLGIMSITNRQLNFMNLVILPILLGFGVSHGLYLLHRFLEGTSPLVAFRSVGAAVASSTLTAIGGFASLFFASHMGLQSIGYVAVIGLATTLLTSFTVLAATLQIIYDKNRRAEQAIATAAAANPATAPGK